MSRQDGNQGWFDTARNLFGSWMPGGQSSPVTLAQVSESTGGAHPLTPVGQFLVSGLPVQPEQVAFPSATGGDVITLAVPAAKRRVVAAGLDALFTAEGATKAQENVYGVSEQGGQCFFDLASGAVSAVRDRLKSASADYINSTQERMRTAVREEETRVEAEKQRKQGVMVNAAGVNIVKEDSFKAAVEAIAKKISVEGVPKPKVSVSKSDGGWSGAVEYVKVSQSQPSKPGEMPKRIEQTVFKLDVKHVPDSGNTQFLASGTEAGSFDHLVAGIGAFYAKAMGDATNNKVVTITVNLDDPGWRVHVQKEMASGNKTETQAKAIVRQKIYNALSGLFKNLIVEDQPPVSASAAEVEVEPTAPERDAEVASPEGRASPVYEEIYDGSVGPESESEDEVGEEFFDTEEGPVERVNPAYEPGDAAAPRSSPEYAVPGLRPSPSPRVAGEEPVYGDGGSDTEPSPEGPRYDTATAGEADAPAVSGVRPGVFENPAYGDVTGKRDDAAEPLRKRMKGVGDSSEAAASESEEEYQDAEGEQTRSPAPGDRWC